jgi:ferrochelatase
MRYQNPSVASAMGRLRQNGVDQIIVFPLFPQYSSAAGGSAVGQIYELAAKEWNIPSFHVVPPYYDHPAFIKALAAVSKPLIEDFKPDHILFSYHGLPERHILKSEEGAGGHCLSSEDCCARIQSSNRFCYRAHCMATTRALVQELALPSTESSFQSRLGKNPWVKPYTDEVIPKLAKSGIKRLAVLCPAFTADCLETIEEVGMEARKSFLEHGGDDFLLIPCLNSADAWVEAVAEIAFSPVD